MLELRNVFCNSFHFILLAESIFVTSNLPYSLERARSCFPRQTPNKSTRLPPPPEIMHAMALAFWPPYFLARHVVVAHPRRKTYQNSGRVSPYMSPNAFLRKWGENEFRRKMRSKSRALDDERKKSSATSKNCIRGSESFPPMGDMLRFAHALARLARRERGGRRGTFKLHPSVAVRPPPPPPPPAPTKTESFIEF